MADYGKIRVLIADRHRLYREGFRLLLENKEGIEIVGEPVNGIQMINVIRQCKPDVALVDAALPEIEGIQFILMVEDDGTKSLILANGTDDDVILGFLRAGVRGYLKKNATVTELIKAIRTINDGEMWVERKIVTKFVESQISQDKGNLQDGMKETLSQREREVLSLLSEGLSNGEIAEKLFISEKTIKNHLNTIFKKLNVKGRFEAVLVGLKKGLC